MINNIMKEKELTNLLKEKAKHVRIKTLEMHKIAKGIRIASCLSSVEIFVLLYYSGLFNFNEKNRKKDRLIISKAHGALCVYPILSESRYIDENELYKVGQDCSILGIIPDLTIPGFDIVIGSLGHGLGVGCGLSIALKKNNIDSTVVVVCGDGELYEGSVWEAIMFAGHHKLDNLLLVVDNNGKCMLDCCRNVIDLEPLNKKFETFGWKTEIVKDGNNVIDLYNAFKKIKQLKDNKPRVLIAYTLKGKGIDVLEKDPQAHIRSLSEEEINKVIKKLQ
ncbi:MAG: thiamine pyrophosphate-dependent enzyme [Endomicrobia bacterium]|nr:thiamine pyrophosphate-dependent enzyme [Endomicrobiia bacterium]